MTPEPRARLRVQHHECADMQDSGFTLDQLAVALRGMPRGAPVLIELPDGRFVEIASVKPQHVLAREGRAEASTSAHGLRDCADRGRVARHRLPAVMELPSARG